MFIRCEVSSSLILTAVSLFVHQISALSNLVFIWAFPFLIYKGIRIGRAHKGRGDNYDLRIRKQTGADSHVLEARLLLALPKLFTTQNAEELPER